MSKDKTSPPSLLRTVSRTGAFNLGSTAIAALNGIIIARALRPTGRGDYASVITILGFTMLIFELGIGSGLVYWCAADRSNASRYMSSALRLLVGLAVLASVTDLVIVHMFIHQPDRHAAALLLPFAVLISFLSAPATFGLQSLDIGAWNVARLAQPLAFLLAALGLNMVVEDLRAIDAMGMYCASLAAQALLAWFLARKSLAPQAQGANKPPAPEESQSRILRFGLTNLLSTAPYALNARIDQLMLSFMVSAASLGNYAVAVSLSMMISPLVGAFGNVAFPHIAKGENVQAAISTAFKGALLTSMIGVALSLVLGVFAVPLLYGHEYTNVVPLLFALAPGACFVTTNQVLGDVLRGMNQSRRVAVCEWTGAILTVTLLALTIPHFGSMGAAWTSSAVYATVFLLLLRQLAIARKE